MKIYVNVNAGHDGNGTEQMPFRHINDAAKIAQPGDEVWVAPGVYREYVDPVHAGREDANFPARQYIFNPTFYNFLCTWSEVSDIPFYRFLHTKKPAR